MADEREPDAVVDLLGGTGTVPLWGMASTDPNATLLAWPPGHEVVEDTNSDPGALADHRDIRAALIANGPVPIERQQRPRVALTL